MTQVMRVLLGLNLLLVAVTTITVSRGEKTSFTVFASDNTWVDHVDYFMDGTWIGTVQGVKVLEPGVIHKYELSWQAPHKRGTHSLRVVAYDAATPPNISSLLFTVVVK